MTNPVSILLVDDDPTSIAVLRRPLSELGQLRFAMSGADALRLAHHRAPDLVLLDIEMPVMTGFEVCMEMKRDALLRDVPIIFITSHDEIEQEVTGLGMGAADFISKPLRIPLVMARVRTQLAMKAMSDALRHAATTDSLTGLANRRLLDDTLAREWARCQRTRLPLSLLMIDADCFKAYNDRYGHQAGDHCLASIASTLRQAARRPADLCARYGGEEFCVLLPDTPLDGATQVAHRLLALVDRLQLPHAASSVTDHVTLSIGGASYRQATDPALDGARPAPAHGVCALLSSADEALYAAKRAGRHRARMVEVEPGCMIPEPPRLTAGPSAAPPRDASHASSAGRASSASGD